MSKKMPLKRFLDAIKADQDSMATHRAAKSQGVERAQPVEPCYGEAGFCYIHRRLVRFCRKEGLVIREPFDKLHDEPAAQPVEGPRPITPNLYLDEPEMVDALRSKGYQVIAPVEGVERVTDDRPAETIPADLESLYSCMGLPAPHVLHAKDFNNMAVDIQRLIERTGRAETRVEMLEAAQDITKMPGLELTKLRQRCEAELDKRARAALAAPSGDTAKEKV